MGFINRVFVTTAPVTLFALICVVIRWTGAEGDRLYDFFFQRSFVQFMTLFVFSWVITLLSRRLAVFLCSRRQLRAALKGRDGRQDLSGNLADRMNAVRKALTSHGGSEALSRVKLTDEEEKNKTGKGYDLINGLVFALPVLGLFGTILGLSNSLFTAFSGGAAVDESVRQFVTSLSTALDTTVLALACAMIAAPLGWLLNRAERDMVDRQGRFVMDTFELNQFALGPLTGKGVKPAGPNFSVIKETFQTELRALTAEIVKDTGSKFEAHLAGASESYRSGLDQAFKKILTERQKHGERMVGRVASRIDRRLSQSIDQVGRLIERQNGRSARDFTSRIGQLEKTLRKRTPTDVIIRYPHDGNTFQEAHDVRKQP